jgi:hypothetical protein
LFGVLFFYKKTIIMDTVIKFYNEGIEVERSFFTYDERKQLEQAERALRAVHEKTGKWIKEIELNANEEKKFSIAIGEERKELVVMFLKEAGK